jgi:hypothetical protein
MRLLILFLLLAFSLGLALVYLGTLLGSYIAGVLV